MFIPLPMTLPCPVPVTPEGETMRDGDSIPLDERTHLCAIDAHWMIGSQISCDIHTALACSLMDIDFDELVLDAGRTLEEAHRPWGDRKRYTQDDARKMAAK